VFLLTSLYTCTCAKCFPSIHLCLASQVHQEGVQNHVIVRLTYLCHMIGQKSIVLSFLYINPVELGLEVAFNNGSAVAYYEADLLK